MSNASGQNQGSFPFRFGIAAAQTVPWETLTERWRVVEELGFDSAWVFDHFMSTNRDANHWHLEAWTALAGLAALTSRVQLGVLVSGNTYRPPSLLAKQAVTVDHISNGRLIIGMGAGWHEPEHTAYDFYFPPPGERVSRFREAMEVIKSLTTQERSDFDGRYYHLRDAPFEPKPVRPEGIPLLIGTRGSRMLGLTARYADIWNAVASPEQFRELGQTLREACEKIGRDPNSIRWSAAAWPGRVGFDPLSSPERFRDLVHQYREVGISELICMWTPETDRAALERIAAELPAWRAS